MAFELISLSEIGNKHSVVLVDNCILSSHLDLIRKFQHNDRGRMVSSVVDESMNYLNNLAEFVRNYDVHITPKTFREYKASKSAQINISGSLAFSNGISLETRKKVGELQALQISLDILISSRVLGNIFFDVNPSCVSCYERNSQIPGTNEGPGETDREIYLFAKALGDSSAIITRDKDFIHLTQICDNLNSNPACCIPRNSFRNVYVPEAFQYSTPDKFRLIY